MRVAGIEGRATPARSTGWGPLGIVARVLLLPVLAAALWVGYTHTLPWVTAALPTPGLRSVAMFSVAHMIASLLFAGAWAAIFAPPLAWCYRRFAWIAGAVCAAPLVLTFVSVLRGGSYTPGTWLLDGFRVTCVALLVPAAAWLASRRVRQHQRA